MTNLRPCRRTRVLGILGCVAPFGLVACGSLHRPTDAEPNSASELATARRLAEEVEAWVEAGDVVGVELILLRGDEVLVHGAWGLADLVTGEPMRPDGVISIKSMTKPVVATAVLLLAEEGALSLEDPVSQYLGGWAGDPRVTVRHLLLQTSGDDGSYEDGGFNIYEFESLAAWVEDWLAQPTRGTYGEFAYSNWNYAALGWIVEQVSGMACETFLERRILAPLAMEESWCSFAPDEPWAHRVPGRHRLDPASGRYQRFWCNEDSQPWSFFPAALGLWMTGRDYARFLRLWLDEGRRGDVRSLSEETVADALAPRRSASGEPLPYGLGWFVDRSRTSDGRPTAFVHGGADGSVGLAFPGSDGVALYLTQSLAPFHVAAFHNQLCMSGLFDHPGPEMDWAADHDVPEVVLGLEERLSFVGTYLEEEGGVAARVLEEDGHLVVRIGPASRRVHEVFHLVPLEDGRFAYGRYGAEGLVGIDLGAVVSYLQDSTGVVTMEVATERGVEFRGTLRRAVR